MVTRCARALRGGVRKGQPCNRPTRHVEEAYCKMHRTACAPPVVPVSGCECGSPMPSLDNAGVPVVLQSPYLCDVCALADDVFQCRCGILGRRALMQRHVYSKHLHKRLRNVHAAAFAGITDVTDPLVAGALVMARCKLCGVEARADVFFEDHFMAAHPHTVALPGNGAKDHVARHHVSFICPLWGDGESCLVTGFDDHIACMYLVCNPVCTVCTVVPFYLPVLTHAVHLLLHRCAPRRVRVQHTRRRSHAL